MTSHVNIDVSRLSDRDIPRIIMHWTYGKPIAAIVQDFLVFCQRIYKLITCCREAEEYPTVRKPGRQFRPVDKRIEEIILESFRINHVGPPHMEKKIEETHGIHFPHNRIYQTLLIRGLVENNIRKRQQRKYVRYERAHSISLWQRD